MILRETIGMQIRPSWQRLFLESEVIQCGSNFGIFHVFKVTEYSLKIGLSV